MSGAPVYRKVSLGESPVVVEKRPGGELLVRVRAQLAEYPTRITDRLVKWAREAPDRTFVAKRGPDGEWQRVSFVEMLQRARSIGQALLDRELSAERPLVILSDNDIEHASLAAAALYAGVPFAPISPPYSLVSRDHAKLRHIIDLLTPGLVFASDGQKYFNAIEAAVPREIEVVVTGNPQGERPNTLFSQLMQTVATSKVDAANQAVGPESIAKFLFTSGSTREPKGVINTQRMLCSNQQVIVQSLKCLAEEPPVLVDWLPWNHTFGGNHNYGIAMYNGGTLYIDDGKPVADLIHETLRNLREISPTVYFNVPKGYEEIAKALRSDPALRQSFFRRVKMLFYAGAGLPRPVSDELYRIAEEHCGERVGIYTGLGMTETAPFAIGSALVEDLPGTIGCPAPGVTLKLVPNEGKLEVRYKGDCVTPGYWRSPEQTRASFDEEGFFFSGDAVKFVDPARPDLGFVFDGRIAEDFKLMSGTWVSVGPLRSAALAEGAPYVMDVVVTGHDREEVGLLIFPRLDSCRALASLGADATLQQVAEAAPVRAAFQRLVNHLCATATGSANRVARAVILTEPPSIDRGEVTDKGSLNQRVVLAHRAAAVEELYRDGGRVILAETN